MVRSLSASMKAQDHREVVEKITVPVTYFYADPGSLFSPELAGWYREHVKTKFQALRFPGSDHMLVTNDPGRFTEGILRLL